MKQKDIETIIDKVLHVKTQDIEDVKVLKKGMTNRSFIFQCKGKRYIMRIPGEGTEQLINRRQEANVYQALEGYDICDPVVYINPDNGYKLTKYLEESRVCDPSNDVDVKKSIQYLRRFHEKKISVSHEFNIFAQIDFYEKLWGDNKSIHKDYYETKEKIYSLQEYIESYVKEKVLTHIDAVPDNFLFYIKDGKEEIRLIDWEYAGMQDPHVDIAMFCIYALYDRKRVDWVISEYFNQQCDEKIRIKIYCYIAAGGLLWSNWCEYKRKLGIEFGKYARRQYDYAKQYYTVVKDELEKLGK